ncbi:DinB family protein [Paenibacillus sp. 481]|uniref:DinB family protein n=1 Tax=Paenibacillus sp. 481 TaxID=2835869 RepID=UPI001E328C82|nr:DinB family protein [Paenibacillus sp. 481]UHA73791.1 DinB family protein [Paenibacillus sp. 481]
MSNGKKELLLDQLATCQDDESWFMPLSRAVQDLSVEQAIWHEGRSSHSIWQLVHHLYVWNSVWLERFRVNEVVSTGYRNEETFDVKDISEEAWQAAVSKLNDCLSEWRSELAAHEESKLDETIDCYGELVPWWQCISNLCTHNVYHIGQIIQLRKQQGSWNAPS